MKFCMKDGLKMRIVPVELGKNSYEIYIGNGLEQKIGEFCQQADFSDRGLIVTGALYGQWLQKILQQAGLRTEIFEIPAGESSKSMAMAEKLFTKCIEMGMDRKSPVFALGGGVVGDLAGFVAATYMRGVPFVQVPTSLLAQVDSSVGGKVAVNHSLGKNLIGAFYQPKAVFMDLNTLRSLPEREIYTGLGEIIKYGIIYDAEFFQYLENNIDKVVSLDNEAAAYMTARSCEIKAAVVSQDEKELGLRAILNFGHTAAHAIEKNTGYTKYNHGEAVAIGMVCAAYISKALGMVSQSTVDRVISLILKLHLPIKAQGCSVDDLYRDIFHDKKTVGGKVKWILMEAIGKVCGNSNVPEEVVRDAMSRIV